MRRTLHVRRFFALLVSLVVGQALVPAHATPAITMDMATGEVLYQQDATQPWFPASTTKLMTVYVALSAVRDGKIAMNTPLAMSARAHHVPPSKMGFPVGTQVTLDNALKMLMVRSANDIAIVVAEGVSGSVEAFAEDMNRAAAELGMRESHFVNPNGLPDSDHYSSARDMALIARALYTQFPNNTNLFDIGALSLGPEIIGNHNNLLGRYPGADGMKTGFTCAAGFNIVATAFRDGRRIVAVVFGAPSVPTRTAKIAALFDRGFAGIDRPSGLVASLPASAVTTPIDMHDQVCRNRAPLVAQFTAETEQLDAPLTTSSTGAGLTGLSPERTFLFNGAPPAQASSVPTALMINSMPAPVFEPIPVHVGAEQGYTGVVAQARAPHSAIGSEPEPLAVEAYAAVAPRQSQRIGNTPLSVDDGALPMKGRKGKLGKAPRRGRATMNAAAEAPKTKVLAGAEGANAAAAKPAKAKAVAKAATAKKVGAKPAVKPAKTAGKKVKSAAGE